MARYLSQKQILEFRECFDLYDKRHHQKIRGSDLITVMRSLGLSPTIREVRTHLKTYEKSRRDHIDFDTFLNIMHAQISKEAPTKEIHHAFRLSDTFKRGFIPAQELRHILTHFGERLTNRECDQMFRAANIQPNGYVKYDEFVRMVTLPLPEM